MIEQVGPGGNFISEKHTMDHFRDQMYFSKWLNRHNYDNWLAEGGKSFGQKANTAVKEILAAHRAPALQPEQEKEIRQVAARRK